MGQVRRPAGAHAAPRRARRAAAPPGRLLPGPLPALLLGIVGVALAVAGVLPSASPEPDPATLAVAAADVRPLDGAVADDESARRPDEALDHASRSRVRPEPALEAQAAVPPVPAPPPPPPPPPVLPGCAGDEPDLDGYANGRLPSSVLCTLPGSGQALRADAAVAFVRLAQAYETHFGREICLTDGYRTLGQQQALKRAKPRLAARPGTSEHGWGIAVDLACGVESFRSAQHRWLVANAGSFGWYQPSWARRGGAKPEPWHWEYDG